MAQVRQIVLEGDPVLRRQAAEVRRFNPVLHKLLDDMKYTMYDAGGVGLAAPQVGISKRAIVVDDRENGFLELVNPLVTFRQGEEEDVEYCLSVPRCGGLVKRAAKIGLTYQDRFGEKHDLEAEDFFARVLQHEIDHLFGRLFVDIMTEEVKDEA